MHQDQIRYSLGFLVPSILYHTVLCLSGILVIMMKAAGDPGAKIPDAVYRGGDASGCLFHFAEIQFHHVAFHLQFLTFLPLGACFHLLIRGKKTDGSTDVFYSAEFIIDMSPSRP